MNNIKEQACLIAKAMIFDDLCELNKEKDIPKGSLDKININEIYEEAIKNVKLPHWVIK